MLKTDDDPQLNGPAPFVANGQVRPQARHRSADNLDGSTLSVTVMCERPSAGAFVACTKPQWEPGDATRVAVDDQRTTYLPLLLEVES